MKTCNPLLLGEEKCVRPYNPTIAPNQEKLTIPLLNNANYGRNFFFRQDVCKVERHVHVTQQADVKVTGLQFSGENNFFGEWYKLPRGMKWKWWTLLKKIYRYIYTVSVHARTGNLLSVGWTVEDKGLGIGCTLPLEYYIMLQNGGYLQLLADFSGVLYFSSAARPPKWLLDWLTFMT